MANIISHNYRSFAKNDFYSIKKIANQNWNNYKILAKLQSELQRRKTDYSKNLRARIEIKLNVLVKRNWDEPRILQNMQDALFGENSYFADILCAKINGRLEELKRDCFLFPDTEISGADFELKIIDRQAKGLLSAVGYRTGRSGLHEKDRRDVLNCLYTKQIPQNTCVEGIEKWGNPVTSTRLRRIVCSIANFTRQEKGNYRGDYRISISEREADLRYLKRKYYDNSKYDWIYPKT